MKLKWSRELKYNVVFAVLLVLIGETWDISVDWIFNNPSGKWMEFKPAGILFFLTFNISYFSVYTINYLVIAPRFLKPSKIVQFFGGFLFLMLCFAGMRFFLEEVLAFQLFGAHNYNLNRPNILWIYLADSAIYSMKPCLFSSLLFLVFRYSENQTKVHQLEMQHQEAQMAMLRSQISPHFLFNTLNGFYSDLYDTAPQTAKDILKLSQLLRYVTYEVNQNFMPLQKEVDFIKDYIYFYKKRYEDDFYVKLSIDGHVANQMVPSLILIHFVENVCKHGVINEANTPAHIQLAIGEYALEIRTDNAINTSEKYMDKGIGTDNIKKRLELLFGSAYTLDYSYNGDRFTTYLKMPL